jgi:hypothetical protein
VALCERVPPLVYVFFRMQQHLRRCTLGRSRPIAWCALCRDPLYYSARCHHAERVLLRCFAGTDLWECMQARRLQLLGLASDDGGGAATVRGAHDSSGGLSTSRPAALVSAFQFDRLVPSAIAAKDADALAQAGLGSGVLGTATASTLRNRDWHEPPPTSLTARLLQWTGDACRYVCCSAACLAAHCVPTPDVKLRSTSSTRRASLMV